MRVVLDTCVYVQDPLLRGSAFSLLRDAIGKGGRLAAVLYVPRLVLDELLNKHSELVRAELEKIRAIERRVRSLTELSPLPDYRSFLDLTIRSYAATIEARLKDEFRARVGPDYPNVSHLDLVKRALQRRKPFSSDGRTGYRDALLWETLLSMAMQQPQNQVVFVSTNTKDFGKDGLHDDLVKDLRERRIRSSAIRYFESLERFNDELVVPTLSALEEARKQLESGSFQQFNLVSWARAELADELLGLEAELLEACFGAQVDRSARVLGIRDVRPPSVQYVRRMHEGEFVIRAAIPVTFDLEIADTPGGDTLQDGTGSLGPLAAGPTTVDAILTVTLILRKSRVLAIDIERISGSAGSVPGVPGAGHTSDQTVKVVEVDSAKRRTRRKRKR